MKAQKVKLKVNLELLDIASARALLMEMTEQIGKEYESGSLSASDGDSIEWETIRGSVEF